MQSMPATKHRKGNSSHFSVHHEHFLCCNGRGLWDPGRGAPSNLFMLMMLEASDRASRAVWSSCGFDWPCEQNFHDAYRQDCRIKFLAGLTSAMVVGSTFQVCLQRGRQMLTSGS